MPQHLPLQAGNWAALNEYLALPSIPLGNRVMCLGDSITSNGNSANGWRQPLTLRPQSYLGWAMFLSGGRIRHAGASATGALTIPQIINTVQSDGATDLGRVVSTAQKPGACVVLAGTNDVGNLATIASIQSGLTTIYSQLLTAGIVPICCALPPRNADATAARSLLYQVNAWIAWFADQNGLPFVDFFAATVDATNGNFASGLNQDNVHPSGLGAKAMGQALCDRLVGTNYLSSVTGLAGSLLPPWQPPLAYANTDQSSGLLSGNKLNLTDGNADGVADGWTLSGAGATGTLVADAGNIKGNYQVLTRAAADANVITSGTIAITPGDVVLWAAKIACTVKGVAASASFQLRSNGGTDLYSIRDWTEDIPSGSVIVGEVVVPTNVSGGTMQVLTQAQLASTAAAKIAQVQAYNLTALGIA